MPGPALRWLNYFATRAKTTRKNIAFLLPVKALSKIIRAKLQAQERAFQA